MEKKVTYSVQVPLNRKYFDEHIFLSADYRATNQPFINLSPDMKLVVIDKLLSDKLGEVSRDSYTFFINESITASNPAAKNFLQQIRLAMQDEEVRDTCLRRIEDYKGESKLLSALKEKILSGKFSEINLEEAQLIHTSLASSGYSKDPLSVKIAEIRIKVFVDYLKDLGISELNAKIIAASLVQNASVKVGNSNYSVLNFLDIGYIAINILGASEGSSATFASNLNTKINIKYSFKFDPEKKSFSCRADFPMSITDLNSGNSLSATCQITLVYDNVMQNNFTPATVNASYLFPIDTIRYLADRGQSPFTQELVANMLSNENVRELLLNDALNNHPETISEEYIKSLNLGWRGMLSFANLSMSKWEELRRTNGEKANEYARIAKFVYTDDYSKTLAGKFAQDSSPMKALQDLFENDRTGYFLTKVFEPKAFGGYKYLPQNMINDLSSNSKSWEVLYDKGLKNLSDNFLRLMQNQKDSPMLSRHCQTLFEMLGLFASKFCDNKYAALKALDLLNNATKIFENKEWLQATCQNIERNLKGSDFSSELNACLQQQQKRSLEQYLQKNPEVAKRILVTVPVLIEAHKQQFPAVSLSSSNLSSSGVGSTNAQKDKQVPKTPSTPAKVVPEKMTDKH
jgi:hypothetical protein